MSRAPGHGRLGGDLDVLGMAELVQTLAQGRKTARVRLRSESRLGELWFREGEMVHAAAGGLYGDLAVYAMLAWRRGEFQVDYGLTSELKSITQDATLVVLEGLRRIDEQSPVPDVPAPAPQRRPGHLGVGLAAAGLVVAILGGMLADAPDPVAADAPFAEPAPVPQVESPATKPARKPAPRLAPARSHAPKQAAPAPVPVSAPESPLSEQPVPFDSLAPAPALMLDTMEPATVPTSATLMVSGKSSKAGGALTILVDGVQVLAHGPLDEGASFEASIDIPAGEHLIVARLDGGAEDSVRGTFESGESRSLRIAAHRTFGAPVKLKLGRPERKGDRPL